MKFNTIFSLDVNFMKIYWKMANLDLWFNQAISDQFSFEWSWKKWCRKKIIAVRPKKIWELFIYKLINFVTKFQVFAVIITSVINNWKWCRFLLRHPVYQWIFVQTIILKASLASCVRIVNDHTTLLVIELWCKSFTLILQLPWQLRPTAQNIFFLVFP